MKYAGFQINVTSVRGIARPEQMCLLVSPWWGSPAHQTGLELLCITLLKLLYNILCDVRYFNSHLYFSIDLNIIIVTTVNKTKLVNKTKPLIFDFGDQQNMETTKNRSPKSDSVTLFLYFFRAHIFLLLNRSLFISAWIQSWKTFSNILIEKKGKTNKIGK